jgi:hypothetical protein
MAWMTGVQFTAGAKDLPLLHSVQTGSEFTQPPVQWVQEEISPDINRPGLEADRSPSSGAEV